MISFLAEKVFFVISSLTKKVAVGDLTEMTTLGDDIRLVEESFPAVAFLMIAE